MWKVGTWASVVWFPGAAGSLAAGSVSQFSIPTKERFISPSKGVGNRVMFPHPLFIQTLCVFKGYLCFCFEHFTGTLLFIQAKAWSTTEYLSCCTDWIQVCFASVIPPFWCIKNIMGEKHFLDSLNIPCVTALWQSSVCKRHDSRRDSPALGCTVKEKCYLLFCPDGFGTGKLAMTFQRVAAIPLSISLPCSTVHS